MKMKMNMMMKRRMMIVIIIMSDIWPASLLQIIHSVWSETSSFASCRSSLAACFDRVIHLSYIDMILRTGCQVSQSRLLAGQYIDMIKHIDVVIIICMYISHTQNKYIDKGPKEMWLKTLKSSWLLISPHVCPLKHPWIRSTSVAWPLQGERAKSSMNIFGYNFIEIWSTNLTLKGIHQTSSNCVFLLKHVDVNVYPSLQPNSCVMLDWLQRAWLVVRALKKPEPPLGVLSTTAAFNNARSSALLRWFEICVFWSILLKTRKGNDMKPLKDIENWKIQ